MLRRSEGMFRKTRGAFAFAEFDPANEEQWRETNHIVLSALRHMSRWRAQLRDRDDVAMKLSQQMMISSSHLLKKTRYMQYPIRQGYEKGSAGRTD